jgi:hypothetical protein
LSYHFTSWLRKACFVASVRKFISLVVLGIALPLSASNPLPTTTTLSLSTNNTTVGTSVLLTASVADQNNVPITLGQVKFCDADAPYCMDMALLGTA